jgi:hypothetical protein
MRERPSDKPACQVLRDSYTETFGRSREDLQCVNDNSYLGKDYVHVLRLRLLHICYDYIEQRHQSDIVNYQDGGLLSQY